MRLANLRRVLAGLALPLVGSIALGALGLGGCSTAPCKSGTVLATVTLEGDSANADDLLITVVSAAGTKTGHVAHAPGLASGTVEVDFPGGYPAGATVTVLVSASAAGRAVGAGQVSTTLPATCGAVSITVSAAGGSVDLLGSPDLAGQSVPDLVMADLVSVRPDLGDLATVANLDGGASADGAVVDAAVPDDAGAPDLLGDLSGADFATPDLALSDDLAGAADLSAADDLASPPDWAVSPDLTRPPDLVTPPDLTRVDMATCMATSPSVLHFVDQVGGVDDPVHGGGAGACAYKTLTYALTQARGPIALATQTFNVASGTSFPIFLTGSQKLLCNFTRLGPAKIQGRGLNLRTNLSATIVFEGTDNQVVDCQLDAAGARGYCIEITSAGNSLAAGHAVTTADLGNCGTGAILVEPNGGNVAITSNTIHGAVTGISMQSGGATTISSNTFVADTVSDITCNALDPLVTGGRNVGAVLPLNKPSCSTCQNCPF